MKTTEKVSATQTIPYTTLASTKETSNATPQTTTKATKFTNIKTTPITPTKQIVPSSTLVYTTATTVTKPYKNVVECSRGYKKYQNLCTGMFKINFINLTS